MAKATPWYEDDRFWKAVKPLIFGSERVAGTVKEIEDVLLLTKTRAGASVLDLCCGIGRHSLELARRGYCVTAVDRTREYLDVARKAATREGLRINFVQKDMRQFYRHGGFDCALNLFTSFGYFEDPRDDRRVLSNVYRSLRPGGTFVLELIGKEVLARIFKERDWQEKDGIIVLQECLTCDNWSRISNRWIVMKGKSRRELRFTHSIYSAAELRELLKAVGFRSIEVFGNLDGSAYDHKAQRLVVRAKK